MNKLVLFFVGLFVSLMMYSCQREISIDLNSASPQIVVEADIQDQNGIQTVKITKTANFSSPSIYDKVQGAEVVISDNAGNSEKLTEVSAGIYQTKNLKGVEKRTYFLSIKTGSQVFTSQCTMPQAVDFKGINMLKRIGFGNAKDLYIAVPQFVDPANVKNHYRFIQYVNNKKDENFLIRNDNITDGLPNQQPIASRNFEIKLGDSLQVDMMCIDESVYDYFYSLNQSAGRGPGGGATPSNPLSNISGGALGYFNAYSSNKKSVIVP